jgi:hypothetical protein
VDRDSSEAVRAAGIESTIGSAVAQASDLQSSLQESLVAAEAQVKLGSEHLSLAKEQFDQFLAASKDEIEAARALAHESGALKGATSVWRRKLWKHRLVFSLGFAALAGAVGVSIWQLVSHWHVIIDAIPRKPDGDIAYGTLLFVVLPVIGVAWVARIFAKWVTNAITLGEDAEQRSAMLETYFRLVGDPNAKMEAADRILILNAIFRPLPGFQTEDVAPPTLSDLIKDAVGGRK